MLSVNGYPHTWVADLELESQDMGLGALRTAAGFNAGSGGFGSPFMGGAHAGSVFRGGFSAFPALSSAAPQPLGLSSLQTLSAPADTLPQVWFACYLVSRTCDAFPSKPRCAAHKHQLPVSDGFPFAERGPL